jgi:hypothetical protein
MHEIRKRVLWICASILAAERLTKIEPGKQNALLADVTQDAVLKAARIIRQIYAR